jgi:hypothetical protein
LGDLLIIALLLVSLLITVSSLDDAFIDLLAMGITRFRSPRLNQQSGVLPRTAVFVANWHEEDVLGKMVEGNLARIQIPEVSFFLGVYPNDTGTLRVAKELEAKHPDRVCVIVNTLPGPTSKGQMLNEMFAQVFSREDCPEMAVLHDSEDVIDPRTFPIYAAYAVEHDFIQVPVFSLNRGKGAHVASTYMDEFAEPLAASIKQKSRWVYGINFEAAHKLGWDGDLWDVYFFMRDRKGMITNFLPAISMTMFGLLFLDYIDLSNIPPGLEPLLEASLGANLIALIARYVVRVAACRQVYGGFDWIGVAVRWPVALYINMAAVFLAWKTYLGESEFATKPVVWSKTVHELPEDFMAAAR